MFVHKSDRRRLRGELKLFPVLAGGIQDLKTKIVTLSPMKKSNYDVKNLTEEPQGYFRKFLQCEPDHFQIAISFCKS